MIEPVARRHHAPRAHPHARRPPNNRLPTPDIAEPWRYVPHDPSCDLPERSEHKKLPASRTRGSSKVGVMSGPPGPAHAVIVPQFAESRNSQSHTTFDRVQN